MGARSALCVANLPRTSVMGPPSPNPCGATMHGASLRLRFPRAASCAMRPWSMRRESERHQSAPRTARPRFASCAIPFPRPSPAWFNGRNLGSAGMCAPRPGRGGMPQRVGAAATQRQDDGPGDAIQTPTRGARRIITIASAEPCPAIRSPEDASNLSDAQWDARMPPGEYPSDGRRRERQQRIGGRAA